MQKEQSSSKITLILYIAVTLLLPFSFYFIYASFNTLQHDTKIVRQSSWAAGAMAQLTDRPTQLQIKDIDKTLQNISHWVTQNNHLNLDSGTETLSKDFLDVENCWQGHKQSLFTQKSAMIRQQNLQCYALADNLAIMIEKTAYLKQKEIINMYYIGLALVMIFMLLMIYRVKAYIHSQREKHAIYDHGTNLFNKKYFLSELKTSCARSLRHNYPLSMLSIQINNFDTGNYDKNTQEHILKVIGGMITFLTRASDVTCRYDKNHFFILLPDTQKENALVLEDRVCEAFEEYDFDVSPALNFKFLITVLKPDEMPEVFLSRTQNILK